MPELPSRANGRQALPPDSPPEAASHTTAAHLTTHLTTRFSSRVATHLTHEADTTREPTDA